MQVAQGDAGTMFVGDFLDDGQSQAGAFALGRHVGLEGALEHFVGKAGAVVDDVQAHGARGTGVCQRQRRAHDDATVGTLLYGIQRVQRYGLDDAWSWVLIPLLGFTVAGCALTAIVYGLTSREKWNARFNRSVGEDAAAGGTNWFTIAAVALSLLVGTTVLMASIAFSFQRYFEYQVEEGRKISQ